MSTSGKRFGVNSGISLFLVLLVIMCLVSFASLSLTSALADMRLSEKYARQVEWYYSARNEAQRDLAALNLEGGDTISADPAPDGQIIRHYPAGDTLQLTVVFTPVSGDGTLRYRISSEKTESINEYSLDESLHVMQSAD